MSMDEHIRNLTVISGNAVLREDAIADSGVRPSWPFSAKPEALISGAILRFTDGTSGAVMDQRSEGMVAIAIDGDVSEFSQEQLDDGRLATMCHPERQLSPV